MIENRAATREKDWQFEKIARPKLYVAVAAQIEKMLARGELSPGDSLPSERELMGMFGVGRSSIREALMWLSTIGLIEFVSGETARVAAPSFSPILEGMQGVARHYLSRPGGVAQLQDARSVFEMGIVRQAAQRATDQQIVHLRSVLKANLEAAPADLNTFELSDYSFHYEIAKIPGNPIYTGTFDAVAGWLAEQRRISMKIPESMIAARSAHISIFEAIAAHDPNAAVEAMERHLAEVGRYYNEALSQLRGHGV